MLCIKLFGQPPVTGIKKHPGVDGICGGRGGGTDGTEEDVCAEKSDDLNKLWVVGGGIVNCAGIFIGGCFQ